MTGALIFWGTVLLVIVAFFLWAWSDELAALVKPLHRRRNARKIDRLTASTLRDMNRLVSREWRL